MALVHVSSPQASRPCSSPVALPRAAQASSSDWADDEEGDEAAGYYDEPASTTQRFNFSYMSAEAVAEAQLQSDAAWEEGMGEYAELKALLLKRTWRFGTLFAVYLVLGVSGTSAAAELVGAAASYGYVLWLIRDVDAITPDTAVPMKAAEAVEPAAARGVAKLFAAYQQALNPRLLVPVGLLGLAAAWNSVAPGPEWQLGVVDQGCMLGGFLSYKAALLLKLYDDLKPRPRTEEEMMQALRPQLTEVEDVELKLKRPSEMRAEAEAQVQQQNADE